MSTLQANFTISPSSAFIKWMTWIKRNSTPSLIIQHFTKTRCNRDRGRLEYARRMRGHPLYAMADKYGVGISCTSRKHLHFENEGGVLYATNICFTSLQKTHNYMELFIALHQRKSECMRKWHIFLKYATVFVQLFSTELFYHLHHGPLPHNFQLYYRVD